MQAQKALILGRHKKTRASREGVRGKEFARKISGLAAA